MRWVLAVGVDEVDEVLIRRRYRSDCAAWPKERGKAANRRAWRESQAFVWCDSWGGDRVLPRSLGGLGWAECGTGAWPGTGLEKWQRPEGDGNVEKD